MDSRILASENNSAMGLHDECLLGSLLGLKIGMILAVFHVMGIMLEFKILLQSLIIIEMELFDKFF